MAIRTCMPQPAPCLTLGRKGNLPAALAGTFFLLLAGCGGGGDKVSTPVVLANAGTSQIVNKRTVVTLDGTSSTSSTHGALTYAWTQTAGTTVTLAGGTTAQPSFTAPGTSGPITLSLVVRDGQTASAPATVTVQVLNRQPAAVAGDLLTVLPGSTSTLDAAGSSDPDGDPLTQTWTQTSGTATPLQLSASGAAQFTAPLAAANLTFSVKVNDGEMDSAPASRTVVVQAQSANAPTATSQALLSSSKRALVTLRGYGTDPNNLPLSFHWRQVSGTQVTLSDPTRSTLGFFAPGEAGDLGFELAVFNGTESSLPCAVKVQVLNSAPGTPAVTLSPAAPKRGDAISATASAQDPDQDPLTWTYVWKRNGNAVPGATEATFPLGNQAKGDVISCEATASDGSLTTRGAAGVTIQDSPAVITTNAPATAVHGQPCVFQATATDPDGDPVGDFALDSGPAGFTITPGGAVTWTPAGPLMDRRVDMNWGVRLASDPKATATGTITVTDDARLYPLCRTNLNIPSSNGSLEIADFDGTGKQQILIGSAGGLALGAWNGLSVAQTWAYPFAAAISGSVSCLASADADHDGKREIFYACENVIVKLDGVERREVARFGDELEALGGPATLVTWSAMKAADIDGDGQSELVCLGSQSSTGWLYVLDARTLAIKWKISQTSLGSSLAIGNVDTDPALEIITSGGYVHDGVTKVNQWTYGATFGFTVDTGDVDGDGVDEIVGAIDWTAVKIYKATLRAPVYEIPTSDIDAIKVANLDGTGPAEILTGDGQWGDVTVYRFNATTKAYDKVTQMNSQDHGVRGIAVGDLDGDGTREIVWGTGGTSSGADWLVVSHLTPSLTLLWKGGNPQWDGPFVGGGLARIDAGKDNLVFLTPRTASGYSGLRLLAMDPLSGAMEQSQELGSSWSAVAAMDLADVDGDGLDEVLLGSATLQQNCFLAFNFRTGMTLWTSPQVDSPKAIAHADLNGDGKPDLVGITSDSRVYAYDVAGQTSLFTSTLQGGGTDVAVADLDGDGKPEIIALTSTQVVVSGWSAAAGAYLEKAFAGTGGTSLVVADADGDGKPEIYVLGGTSKRTVFRFDGSLQATGSFLLPGAYSLHLEDLGTGRKNLIACVDVTGSSYGTYLPSCCRLVAVDPVNGARIWQSPLLAGGVPLHGLHYVTLAGETRPRMSFGTSRGMFVTR